MACFDIRSDGSEKLKYDYDGFWIYSYRGLLSSYPNYSVYSHWHDDVEFIAVQSGTMDYNVNGEIITLKSGQGIFVNARQLHYGFSKENNECDYYCVLLHPMLLCASQLIDHEFVSPILTDNSLPYIFLNNDIEWQRLILSDVKTIHDCKDKPTAPLHIQNVFYHIWILLVENALKAKQPKKQNQNLTLLKDMLSFIQNNYSKKISLEDIAKSGNVSKSTCLVIFKKYLRNTPTNYLIEYRLKKALNLLEAGEMSITEIALDVGFSGGSYFAETFRKIYGCSPREYQTRSSSYLFH